MKSKFSFLDNILPIKDFPDPIIPTRTKFLGNSLLAGAANADIVSSIVGGLGLGALFIIHLFLYAFLYFFQ